MNTLEFFRTIYPEDGTYYLVLMAGGKPSHRAYDSLEKMAASVDWYEKNKPELTIYHACAAYKQPFVEVEGKKKYRVAQNWHKAKAFWCDIDCGEDKAAEGKGYATKKEAATAIITFCKHNNFPRPMFIDSGNGIHCYWPLTKAIPAETWRRMAMALKALFDHHGLLVDPSRTADFASILRPVGSFHKKGEPKEVVCKSQNEPIAPQEFAQKLNALVKDIPVQKPAATPDALALNDDLLAHVPQNNIPSSAIAIAEKCNQVAIMRDMRGVVDYEHWRAVIGIMKHCTEGDELAHEWSAGHDQYNRADTQAKLDSWNTSPTTCEHFSKVNPSACEGCPHKGKIKTPMVLGRVVEQQKDVVVEAKVDGKVMEVQIPEFPKNYKFESGQMVRYMQDKDEIWHAFPFAPNLFYPVHRIKKEDGEFSLGIRLHLPDHRTREFAIDTSLIASPQKLMDGLGKYELFALTTKDASNHMTAYLREYLEKLKAEVEELNTMTSFGWKDNYSSFLIGDRLYHRDGTVRKVLTGGYAKDKESSFPSPRGSVKGYAEGINFLYNHKGLEYRQYVIGSVFGSVLTPFGDSMFKGLLVAVTGTNTAKGKTTLCRAALYAFGDAEKMTTKSEKGATLNARNARMATYNNIPFLFDEITHIDSQELSDLAYFISMGGEKDRLVVKRGDSGTRFGNTGEWAMSPLATANTDLHSILSGRGDTQAEGVRLIQIRIDQYAMHELAAGEVISTMKKIELNAGSAGEEFIKYVVANLDDVMSLMAQWGKRYEKDFGGDKYRLYRAHAICTLTAIEITNKLGITSFDLAALYDYSLVLMMETAEVVQEKNTITPEEALNRMINDLSPRTITTTEYRDGRDARGPEDVRYSNSQPAAGRYITGNSTTKNNPLAGKLFLSKKDVNLWADKNRVDPKVMFTYAKSAGLLVDWKEKFTLGRGTRISTGNTSVVCIDYDKLQSMNENAPKLTVHNTAQVINIDDTAVNN